MNIKSMTGFGKYSLLSDDMDVTITIRSINSKYCDISLKTPRTLLDNDLKYRKIIQDKLKRGKVDVRIELEVKKTERLPELNIELLKKYKTLMYTLKSEANISAEAGLQDYLKLPDLISFKYDETSTELIEPIIEESLLKAIDDINVMRISEGNILIADIINRLNNIAELIVSIENSKEDVYQLWMDRLKAKMDMFKLENISEDRIIQEAVIHSEKADITEEIVRIHSHITQFKTIIDTEEEIGKKLDFLTIELNREFNTIASKSTKSSIITFVIDAKSQIDKIKEQIQNLI